MDANTLSNMEIYSKQSTATHNPMNMEVIQDLMQRVVEPPLSLQDYPTTRCVHASSRRDDMLKSLSPGQHNGSFAQSLGGFGH
ncbi:hypothetical protein FRC08_010718 [Ceratobasidium sp. 394]|nr:hypothetical protein FRC08_010718 [Ceratobasidium sp. 394]